MPKDIRKFLENYPEESVNLSNNHAKKFENMLHKELHQEKQTAKKPIIQWLSIAASFALLITVAVKFYPTSNNIGDDPVDVIKTNNNNTKTISLGNISPELNTIEAYYVNSINLAMSELEMTDENEDFIKQYLAKVAELSKEYKALTQELNTKGVNAETIDALIQNLQLRLQLLNRLKKKLNSSNELNTKQHENQII